MATRKLKVFAAPIGFYETAIATTSRAAAMRAWGVHQDLFAQGVARETDDPFAIKAALAEPGHVLMRALGGKGQFKTAPESLPGVPLEKAKPGAAHRKAKAPPRPAADRTELSAAEAALDKLEAQWRRQAARLKTEAAALAEKTREARSAHDVARREAAAKVAQARRSYRQAGGRG